LSKGQFNSSGEVMGYDVGIAQFLALAHAEKKLEGRIRKRGAPLLVWEMEKADNDEDNDWYEVIVNRHQKGFEVGLSPWKLRFMANWDGHFAVQVRDGGPELVVNHGVLSGEVYETFVYSKTGTLYFSVRYDLTSGEWSLWGIEEIP
jgi:hypothetical protein